MIQEFKKQLKKYNDPNLWLEQMRIREEKKQTVQQVVIPHESKQIQQPVVVSQSRTVFRKSERLYDKEDANKLHDLYVELEDMLRIPTLSLV